MIGPRAEDRRRWPAVGACYPRASVTGRGVTFILVGLTIAAAVAIAVVAAGDENGPEPPAAGTAVSCDRIADPGDDLAEFLSALSTGETVLVTRLRYRRGEWLTSYPWYALVSR